MTLLHLCSLLGTDHLFFYSVWNVEMEVVGFHMPLYILTLV